MLAKRNKVDGSTPLETLKAWVHWATINPVDEDQKEMAMAINDLFAQVGNWKAKYERLLAETTQHDSQKGDK